MTSDLEGLLAAIRANPEDDLPRLALADWCMDQEDPAERARGEFIHLRCRAAGLAPGDPARCPLDHRALQLCVEHEDAWLAGLRPHLSGWIFERGMLVIEVEKPSRQRRWLDRLAQQPGWKWVTGVRGWTLSVEEVASLVGSTHLKTLTSLDLSGCELRQRGALAIQRSDHSGHLTLLKLGFCQLADEGLTALAGSIGLQRLTTLSLCNNGITATGIQALARATLPRLAILDLGRNPLRDPGVRALLAWNHLVAVSELYLSGCDISDRGALGLLSSSRLETIQCLELTENPLGKEIRRELREHFGPRVRL